MKNPEGFLPSNNGKENADALQTAVNKGGKIIIDIPGEYALADTILVGSDTEIIFGEGVIIRREHCENQDGNAFINRGAFTGKPDKNIKIKGLNLEVNGVECEPASETCKKTIVGLRGHLAFFYIENLILEDISITGLCHKDYGIQISNFRNAVIDTVYIEGNKDGVHYGPGSDFILRNGVFRTGDDPIALNADDYSVSNPTLGIIENGLIENCRDLYEEKNDGFFTRILSGSWGDWYSGMIVRHSDSVVYKGRLFRVVMSPSWNEMISVNPPEFDGNFATIDGIRWAKTGYDAPHCAFVRNITFRNISLEKKREVGFSFSVEQNEYRRGFYEGSDFPSNGNFVFENIKVSEDIKYPIAVRTAVEGIEIKNCKFGKSKMLITDDNQAKLPSPPMKLKLKNNDFNFEDILIENREIIG